MHAVRLSDLGWWNPVRSYKVSGTTVIRWLLSWYVRRREPVHPPEGRFNPCTDLPSKHLSCFAFCSLSSAVYGLRSLHRSICTTSSLGVAAKASAVNYFAWRMPFELLLVFFFAFERRVLTPAFSPVACGAADKLFELAGSSLALEPPQLRVDKLVMRYYPPRLASALWVAMLDLTQPALQMRSSP